MNRTASALVIIALAGSLVIYLAFPLLAFRWVQTPFIGAFVEQTLVFNSVGPQGDTLWTGIEAGLRFPHQLKEIAGVSVQDTTGLAAALATYRPGEDATLTYFDENGLEKQTTITLQAFPPFDFVTYFIIPYLIGLIYLVTGVWVFRLRRDDTVGHAIVLFCVTVAMIVGGLFDLYTTHIFTWVWTLALALAPGALLTLALVFPQETNLVTRYPAARWLGFIPSGILAVVGQWALYNTRRPTAYAAVWRNQYAFAALSLLVFLGFMAHRRWRAARSITREQARIILWGHILAFGPMIYFLTLSSAGAAITFDVTLYFPSLVIFPLAIAYAILRYRATIRLLRMAAAITFLLLGVASSTLIFWAVQEQQSDALVINLAGRQRMLTQRMALQVHNLKYATDPASRAELEITAYTYFGNTLNALIAGGEVPYTEESTVTLPPTRNPEILAQLETVRISWTEMQAAIHVVLEEDPLSASFAEAVTTIERLSSLILLQMDEAVLMYEVQAEQKVTRVQTIQIGFIAIAMVLLIVAYFVSERHFLRPIARLGEVAQRIGEGDLETPVPTMGLGEIDSLAHSFDHMRQQLAYSRDNLARLYNLSLELVSVLEPGEVCRLVTTTVAENLGGRYCLIAEFDSQAGRVCGLAPAYGLPDEIATAINYTVDDEVVAIWDISRKPYLILNDTSNLPSLLNGLTEQAGVHSLLAARITVRDQPIGILFVADKETGQFNQEDARLLVAHAQQAALALERAREHQAVILAQERYHSLFEDVPVGLYRTSPEGHFLEANRALVDILKYPDRDTLLQVNTVDLYVDSESRQRWEDLMASEGVVQGYELQLRCYDGTIIWVKDIASIVRNSEGKVVYYEGSIEDVTERKRHVSAMEAIAEVGGLVTAGGELQTTLESLARKIAMAAGFEGVSIGLYDEEKQELSYPAVFTTQPVKSLQGRKGTRLHLSESPFLGRLLREQKPIYSDYDHPTGGG